MPNRNQIDPPEDQDNPFLEGFPPILPPSGVVDALREQPAFDVHERELPAEIRIDHLYGLSWFVPLEEHVKLDGIISLAIRQRYARLHMEYIQRLEDSNDRVAQRTLKAGLYSIGPPALSLAVIGCSGIGKSMGSKRILARYPQLFHRNKPRTLDQAVWIVLDCPYAGSIKELCIFFFLALDGLLGTCYFARYGKGTTGAMLARMAQLAELHAIGLLVIDEIQHLKQARGTGPESMLNFLVTLVNIVKIPVIIIGTPGALPLLQGNFRQARRFGSFRWDRMRNGKSWRHFISEMWPYQWTREMTPLTNDFCEVLWEESQGVIDVAVKLFMHAQERAIKRSLKGRPERIDEGLLRKVAREDLWMLRPMIEALQRGTPQDIAPYDDLRPL